MNTIDYYRRKYYRLFNRYGYKDLAVDEAWAEYCLAIRMFLAPVEP